MVDPASGEWRDTRRGGMSAPDEEILLEAGAHPWERRLSAQEKLRRGGVTLGVVGFVAFLLLGGPAALAASVGLLGSKTRPLPARPPAVAALAGYTQVGVKVQMPPGSAQHPAIWVSPANDPAGTAYACWISYDAAPQGLPGALHVAHTMLDSATWTVSAPPEPQAAACGIVTDSMDATRLLVFFWSDRASRDACTLPSAYESADAGATWRRVRWPLATARPCSLQLSLIAGDLYAWADISLVPAQHAQEDALGELIWTRDAGASWSAADSGLHHIGELGVIALRPGGRLLIQATTSASHGDLFESADYGAHWHSLGALPGRSPQVYASTNPAMAGEDGWGRLYLTASARNEIAAAAGTVGTGPYIATAFAGGPWSAIAPPIDATAPGGPAQVPLIEARVGPSDTLLATSFVPQDSADQHSAQRFVWIWNPAQRTWSRAHFLLPSGSVIEGLAWYRSSLRFWVLVLGQSSPQEARRLETFLLPPNAS